MNSSAVLLADAFAPGCSTCPEATEIARESPALDTGERGTCPMLSHAECLCVVWGRASRRYSPRFNRYLEVRGFPYTDNVCISIDSTSQ